jgi:hypothetical protein
MGLSKDLIQQFVEVTNDLQNQNEESFVLGTVHNEGGNYYVKIDGSDSYTPVYSTTKMNEGDRVTVMIKNHTATVTGNITSPSLDGTAVDGKIGAFSDIVTESITAVNGTIDNLVSENVTIKNKLTANEAEIETLKAHDVTVEGKLTANQAEIDDLKAKKIDAETVNATFATIESLNATNANVNNLQANYAEVSNLVAQKANISDLNATNANVANLQANKANVSDLNAAVADIKKLDADKADITDLTADNISFTTASGGTLNVQTLLSQFTSGQNAQYLNITGSNATIANAVIKDAMIDSVSVNKLTSGTINTNEINIASDDNSMKIEDGTIQFADEDGNVRLQLGEDASGDFSFILKGEDGTTTLIDGSGIKEGAIADKLIKTGMINDKAITSDKINYQSFVSGLNADGTANLIKSSKIELDGTGQTLNVAFQEIESSIDNIQVGGTNLLINSKGPLYEPVGYYVLGTINPDNSQTFKGNTVYVSNQGVAWSAIRYKFNKHIIDRGLAKVGDIFTYSVWARTTDTGKKLKFLYRTADNRSAREFPNSVDQPIDSNWKQVSHTFTVTESHLAQSTCLTDMGFENTTVCAEGKAVYFSSPKLERGNKATDWTPAPEDAQSAIDDNTSKISTNTTNINVANGRIDTLVSQNEVTNQKLNTIDGNITTISNNYSTLNQTVGGINATVASHTTQITDTNTKIDNIQIGGTNLLKDSDFMIELSSTDSFKQKYEMYLADETDLTARFKDRPVTLSYRVDIQGDISTDPNISEGMRERWGIHSAITWKDSTGTNTGYKHSYPHSTKLNVKDYTGRVEMTDNITPPDGYDTIHTYKLSVQPLCKPAEGNSYVFKLGKPQLEFGNKPTDWSPAPEDVDNAIQTVDTKVTTNTSSIDVLQEQIILKVEQSQVNTTVNNAVNDIKIGGTNLVLNTRDRKAGNINAVPDSNSRAEYTSYNIGTVLDKYPEGTQLTLSFDVNCVKDACLQVYNTNVKGPNTLKGQSVNIKEGMQRVFVVYNLEKRPNPNEASSYIEFYTTYGTNAFYEISKLKIELGNKPTEWSPAPEDVDSAITTVDQRCASIELDVDSITSTVSNNSGNISTLTQTVNGINSTVSSNTGKISTLTNTVNGLNSTVSNHTGSISTLTNTVNGLNTTVSNNAGNISSLQQTANQIVADFGQVGANLILNGRPRGVSTYWNLAYGNGSTATSSFDSSAHNGNNWEGEYFRSGFWFNGNHVGAGYAGIRNDSITSYRFAINKTYSISMIIYNANAAQNLNVQIADANSTNYVCQKIITIQKGYQYVSFTFTPSSSGNTPSLMLMQNSVGNFSYFIPWIVVREGNPTRTWIENGDEINQGSTIINRDGVTIKNGAIRVEDGSGNVMLDGDSNGNLYLRKQLKVGTVGQISQSGVTVTDGNLTVVDAIDKATYQSKINSGELVLTYNALTAGGTPPLESKIGIKEGYNGLYIGCEDYGTYGSIKLDGKVEFTRPLEGQIKLNGLFTPLAGTCIHSACGTSGTGGYVKIARIRIVGTYCNEGVKFSIAQRGKSTITDFYFQFGNTESKDPALAAFTKTNGSANAYMVKNTTSTWDLYVQKSENYDEIAVTDLQIPYRFRNAVVWTWTNEHATTLPAGYTAAKLADVNSEKFYITDASFETLQQSGYNQMSLGVRHTNGDHGIALATAGDIYTLRSWAADKNTINLGTSTIPYKDVWLTGFSRGNTGYSKLPNEMILQWGQVTCNNGSNVTVTFPLKFPTAVYSVWGTGNYSGSRGWTMNFSNMGLTGVTLYKTHYAGGSNSDTIYWVALGR